MKLSNFFSSVFLFFINIDFFVLLKRWFTVHLVSNALHLISILYFENWIRFDKMKYHRSVSMWMPKEMESNLKNSVKWKKSVNWFGKFIINFLMPFFIYFIFIFHIDWRIGIVSMRSVNILLLQASYIKYKLWIQISNNFRIIEFISS